MKIKEELMYNPICSDEDGELATHRIIETNEMICDHCADVHLQCRMNGTLKRFKRTEFNKDFEYPSDELSDDDLYSQEMENRFELDHDGDSMD